MKCLIASSAKQGEATRNCAMKACVHMPNHLSHGGKVGTIGRLVSSYLYYPCHIVSILLEDFAN
jgi:hypothetical protein